MSTFAMNLTIIGIVCILLLASASLIISAWRHGGLHHDTLPMRKNMKKIILRVRKDIKIALHG